MNNLVVGLIPARYASTRLPGKALRPILDKPMVRVDIEPDPARAETMLRERANAAGELPDAPPVGAH